MKIKLNNKKSVFQKTAIIVQRGGTAHLTIRNDDTFGGLVSPVAFKGKFASIEAAVKFAKDYAKPKREVRS